MKITVVIPAFNRPELLRVALQSVAAQTAIAEVVRVLVSENGLNRASEAVCQEFGQLLPIDYRFHEQQLPVLQHLRWAMSQEQEGYVALLCDDDWWDIHHLALAVSSLDANNDCTAYFSSFLYSEDERSVKGSIYENLRLLHVAKKDFLSYVPGVFTKEEVLFCCLLITPFHFSAMVCAGRLLTEAVAVFETVHPTYADRILWTILAGKTPILFNPLPTALIRFHEEMDSKRYNSQEWKTAAQEGSLRVLKFARDNEYILEDELNRIYAEATAPDKEFMLQQLEKVFFDRKNVSWFAGYAEIARHDALANSYKTKAKRFAKQLLGRVAKGLV